MHKRLIIIGSGPAGYTAAIYAARANLEPLVLAGSQSGGQLMITSDVENYPGFPEGIKGPDLMERFRKQAERFGAEIIDTDATRVNLKRRPFIVATDKVEYTADALIVATGANAKWLGLPTELSLRGKGVSACATCDGFFFRDKLVVVVGGGDTAMEEALFLTKFAKHVTVVHRRDKLRASKIMQEKARANPKISFIWNHVVSEVIGKNSVEGVRITSTIDGSSSLIKCDGLFVAIGHDPATALFEGQLEMDSLGYIKVLHNTRTSVEGVFVAGDVHDHRYRQAVTAAGFGCEAAIDAERYLGEKTPETDGLVKVASTA
jgi:thioredoxin reductase (NADPH)